MHWKKVKPWYQWQSYESFKRLSKADFFYQFGYPKSFHNWEMQQSSGLCPPANEEDKKLEESIEIRLDLPRLEKLMDEMGQMRPYSLMWIPFGPRFSNLIHIVGEYRVGFEPHQLHGIRPVNCGRNFFIHPNSIASLGEQYELPEYTWWERLKAWFWFGSWRRFLLLVIYAELKLLYAQLVLFELAKTIPSPLRLKPRDGEPLLSSPEYVHAAHSWTLEPLNPSPLETWKAHDSWVKVPEEEEKINATFEPYAQNKPRGEIIVKRRQALRTLERLQRRLLKYGQWVQDDLPEDLKKWQETLQLQEKSSREVIADELSVPPEDSVMLEEKVVQSPTFFRLVPRSPPKPSPLQLEDTLLLFELYRQLSPSVQEISVPMRGHCLFLDAVDLEHYLCFLREHFLDQMDDRESKESMTLQNLDFSWTKDFLTRFSLGGLSEDFFVQQLQSYCIPNKLASNTLPGNWQKQLNPAASNDPAAIAFMNSLSQRTITSSSLSSLIFNQMRGFFIGKINEALQEHFQIRKKTGIRKAVLLKLHSDKFNRYGFPEYLRPYFNFFAQQLQTALKGIGSSEEIGKVVEHRHKPPTHLAKSLGEIAEILSILACKEGSNIQTNSEDGLEIGDDFVTSDRIKLSCYYTYWNFSTQSTSNSRKRRTVEEYFELLLALMDYWSDHFHKQFHPAGHQDNGLSIENPSIYHSFHTPEDVSGSFHDFFSLFIQHFRPSQAVYRLEQRYAQWVEERGWTGSFFMHTVVKGSPERYYKPVPLNAVIDTVRRMP